MKLEFLQKKYPRFVYKSFNSRFSGKNLEIYFDFKIEPDISFKPKLTIKNVKKVSLSNLDNLIFHLGLIEMLSYWKSTCSPVIEIKCGFLEKKQIKWWQNIIMSGMGQFFFENKIPFLKPNFEILGPHLPVGMFKGSDKGILVPVGGGKDSVVTLESMKKAKKNIRCFSLNPTDSAIKVMNLAGCQKPIIAKRVIDKKLLELNRKGYPNGHTPFSAYLAFLTLLVAAVFDHREIAVSNEKSSNEGNLKHLGKTVNHQWSKSFEFEKKFRSYSRKYLAKNIRYFSFLRSLSEIQIAKLFSRHSKYFPAFLSCNEAYKTASGTKKPSKKWCCKCSKCLFSFLILYPFLEKEEIIKIFDKNLFEDKSLLPVLQQLIGKKGFKPFECVGTRKESLAALYLCWKKNKFAEHSSQPVLLRYFEKRILPK